ncbi:MAG TPA: hypothetical protein PLD59_05860 [Tepidisphaeraceae bacterium]|nr:hypothetical protein [Tepidisphaeraceae bacterium]
MKDIRIRFGLVVALTLAMGAGNLVLAQGRPVAADADRIYGADSEDGATNPATDPAAGTANDPATAPQRRTAPSRQLTDDEMSEALAFIEQNMPNLDRLWSRMPEERQRRMPPRMQMGFKLMLDARKSGDERLYEVLAQQMRLRDEFMSLRREFNRSGGDEEVKKRLLAKVKELVEVGLKQRELRIEKLETMLETEKEKLEADRKNIESQVEVQYQRLEEETSQFVAFLRRFGPMGQGAIVGGPSAPPTTQSQRP